MTTYQNGVTLSREAVGRIVLDGLRDVLAMRNNAGVDMDNLGEETYLIGHGAVLDSMGLVTLVIDVEQRLEDEFDVALILVDEKAMSQKNSPFRSIGSLIDHVCALVAEQ